MSNIVIGVSGGMVQYVYSKEGTEVIVLDQDGAEQWDEVWNKEYKEAEEDANAVIQQHNLVVVY